MTLTRRLALIALATCSQVRAEPSSLPLMLGRDARADMNPQGFLVSEKLDGVRALWDGRSLRFRSGHMVMAPRWFSDGLPQVPLDGELWIGRAQFEPLVATVRRAVPDNSAWRLIRFMAFDQPATDGVFAARAKRLEDVVRRQACPWLTAVEQRTIGTTVALQRHLVEVVAAGGEGLMLHRADAQWQSGRSGDLLKLKPRHDGEAVVVAHVPGRGRHAGRMGGLRVRMPNGILFTLGTGFTDAQRQHPPALGARVTFTHQGFTTAGVPRFASYLRLRSL